MTKRREQRSSLSERVKELEELHLGLAALLKLSAQCFADRITLKQEVLKPKRKGKV